MKLKASYEKGYLRLPENIHLAHDHLELEVEIPDDEVIIEESPQGGEDHRQGERADHESIKETLNAILGPYRGQSDADEQGPDGHKRVWHQHLEAKYIAEE